MDSDPIAFRFVFEPPNIFEQLLLAHLDAGLLRQTPEQLKLAREKRKPTVIDPPVAVKEVERDITDLAKPREQFAAIEPFFSQAFIGYRLFSLDIGVAHTQILPIG